MVSHTDMEMMVIKEETPGNRKHGHAVHEGHVGRHQEAEGGRELEQWPLMWFLQEMIGKAG